METNLTKIDPPEYVAGQVIYVAGDMLRDEVSRSGGAMKQPVMKMRFIDIGVDNPLGRESNNDEIPEALREGFMVNPGFGLSTFIRSQMDEKQPKTKWWHVSLLAPLPAHLQIIFDNDPKGHCTITVVSPMTVKAFYACLNDLSWMRSVDDPK
ncbi:MAG: hypothetical protein RL748_3995 [Pseudomonadota bacterium]|jgi:hypothetical protein